MLAISVDIIHQHAVRKREKFVVLYALVDEISRNVIGHVLLEEVVELLSEPIQANLTPRLGRARARRQSLDLVIEALQQGVQRLVEI